MGQAVKYAALAVAIISVLILAAAVINGMYPTEIVTNFGTSLQGFISSAGSYLQNVRGALNYVFGSPLVFTIAIAFWISVPFLRITYKIAVAVVRFANQ